ncbi:MAG: xanthine dehydrogenase family protein subunit M [Alphaproteobacteria bacterium]
MGSYLRPADLYEALAALAAGEITIVAGGTDFYPARVGRTIMENLLDLSALSALRGIVDKGDRYEIGACTTWTDLIESDLPACFDGVKLAAREVGGVQIQNAGTVAGNICNASPAADGVPPLMALDAKVRLASRQGEREVALADFITGNRKTVRRPDELVTAIVVPKCDAGARATFVKLGARRYLVISIVMAGFVVEPDQNGRVARARISVGACAPVARRLAKLERALVGRVLDAQLGEIADQTHLRDALAPIDDIRATADYRWDACVTVLRRGLNELGAKLGAAR